MREASDNRQAAVYANWVMHALPLMKRSRLAEEGITARKAWELTEEQWRTVAGITEKEIAGILQSKRSFDPEREWQLLQEKGISFVCREESLYPGRLRNIHNPPYGLYYIGRLPVEEELAVSIVGARGRSDYGCTAARQLSLALGRRRTQVISGMALGIDTDAHSGCLEGGGRTYAVLGCGVDVIYPRQNRFLYEQILKTGGGILSEYVPGTAAVAWQFPPRNRIIAGLSDAVVVIEARKKSGSLITADFAMEQGKEVYALPGRICDPLSQGTNQLISQGAGVLTGVEDFLQQLGILEASSCRQLDFSKNLLEKEELMVYSLLDFAPQGLADLMDKTTIDLHQLLEILRSLEQKGFIRESVPNYYVRSMQL